jgi:putative thioredoxin
MGQRLEVDRVAEVESPWIEDVTDDEFEAKVVERSHQVPVVVDFWAEWCGPCRVLGPILEKLAREGEGRFVLAKVDVDRQPRHAQAFGVRGIPTVMGFRNGQLAAEFTGALPEASVREFVNNVCPTEADALVERAEELRTRSSPEAEALFRQALGLDPNHQGAKVGLAESLFARGEIEEAREIVEGLETFGPLGQRVEHLRSQLALRELKPRESEAELRARIEAEPDRGEPYVALGKLLASEKRFPEALETLLKAAEADRGLAEGEVKELMVEIFHAVGIRSDLADEYRTKLSRLLH